MANDTRWDTHRNPLSRLWRPRASTELGSVAAEILRAALGGNISKTGVAVTTDSAVAHVAVLACLIVRSDAMVMMPADVGRRDGRQRIELNDHPVSALLTQAANPLVNAEHFWRWKQTIEDLRGNAHARIEWDSAGKPVALWPMYRQKPQIIISNINGITRIAYRYVGDDTTPPGDYPARDVLHFKGPLLSQSPFEARSLIEATAENIGLGLATEEFFARFIGNGSHFPLYLSTEKALTDADFDRLKKDIGEGTGLFEAGKTRIFDQGLKVQSNAMSLKDADLNPQQRWILEQTCRTFRVPLPMVQDLTHGTYTNSEQADLWLSKYTAAPIAKDTEAEVRQKLFLPSERATHYVKFNVNGMMRGDFATRTAGYSILINAGVMSPNEARAFEDWNPYDGGDEYRVPLNTEPAGGAGDELAAAMLQRSLELTNAPSKEAREGVASITEVAVAHASKPQLAAPTEPKPALTPAIDALAPLLRDARARVHTRAAQDRDRGRDESTTREFAAKVVEPIHQAAAAMQLTVTIDQLVELCLEGAV